jgi:hypothetical protein
VLARRESVRQDQAVPVVGRTDDDGVDFLVLEQLPVVLVEPGRLAARLQRVFGALVERMSAQPMPLQPTTPKRTRSLGAAALDSAAASRPGTRPAPIAARDEPLMMKRLRDPFMSILLAWSAGR